MSKGMAGKIPDLTGCGVLFNLNSSGNCPKILFHMLRPYLWNWSFSFPKAKIKSYSWTSHPVQQIV